MAAAAALLLGVSVGATSASAVVVTGDFLVDNDIGGTVTAGSDGLTTFMTAGSVFATELEGDATEGAGAIAFAFQALEALVTIETNSLNPFSTGFIGASVEWNSAIDGTGVSFGLISGAALALGQQLAVDFAPFETKYLIVRWDDIASRASNFDLRIETRVPLPATILLFGSALLGLGFVSAARKRQIGWQS